MLNTLGILAYIGNKAIHKLGECLGILLYIIYRIHKAVIVTVAIAYVIFMCATGLDNRLFGAIGTMIVIPTMLYVVLSKPAK